MRDLGVLACTAIAVSEFGLDRDVLKGDLAGKWTILSKGEILAVSSDCHHKEVVFIW